MIASHLRTLYYYEHFCSCSIVLHKEKDNQGRNWKKMEISVDGLLFYFFTNSFGEAIQNSKCNDNMS